MGWNYDLSAVDNLLLECDWKVSVLDHGFVRLVDVMGDDFSPVQAARVSYGSGTKTVREDEGLINYLREHEHTTPTEMIELKFHMRLPIFVARQIVRHRTASINEMSGRYSVLPDLFYVPELSRVRKQSVNNKQGSGGKLDKVVAEAVCGCIRKSNERAYSDYEGLLEKGLSRELARIVLPVSVYTEWYWKIDMHNLLKFLRLRLDSHAQWECRQYAMAIAKIVKEKFPLTWKAFVKNDIGSVKLSSSEIEVLREYLDDDLIDLLNREVEVLKTTSKKVEKMLSLGEADGQEGLRVVEAESKNRLKCIKTIIELLGGP